jgi:RNA polymerase sigma-70 factor (ECF subfamily)
MYLITEIRSDCAEGMRKTEVITREEFAGSLRGMERSLFCVARSFSLSEADCEDALQETALKAWASRGQLRQKAYFKTWVTRILINECKRLLRKNRRMLPMAELPMDADRCASQEGFDFEIPLHDALFSLDLKYRLPLVLKYRDGYSVEEISRILRLPSGTVMTRLYRARNMLKQILVEEEVLQL